MSSSLDHSFFAACSERVRASSPLTVQGRVCSIVGNVIETEGLPLEVGALCRVESGHLGGPTFHAEVVGFRGGSCLLMALEEARGVALGARVRALARVPRVPKAEACLGRILDGLGRPIDGGGPLPESGTASLHGRPPEALERRRIEEPLELGVRVLDSLLTTAKGGRIGLFAGSGVGKSTLLGQIARRTRADVNVVALIGERGREVREFVERELRGALDRSVVVVATSDEAPLLRRRCAFLATALAEQFRDEGQSVLLMMDSLTRFCTAQREIGLAAGEPPATRGYPPSLWSLLPQLLERAGNGSTSGSITGIYTVLVEGDDFNEPVADALRALLDGHVVLTRELASRGHYPAVDVLESVSRLMPDVAAPEHLALASRARQLLASYRGAEDLISIGAYVEGSDPEVDEARRFAGPLRAFVQQAPDEANTLQEGVAALREALQDSTAPGVVQ